MDSTKSSAHALRMAEALLKRGDSRFQPVALIGGARAFRLGLHSLARQVCLLELSHQSHHGFLGLDPVGVGEGDMEWQGVAARVRGRIPTDLHVLPHPLDHVFQWYSGAVLLVKIETGVLDDTR